MLHGEPRSHQKSHPLQKPYQSPQPHHPTTYHNQCRHALLGFVAILENSLHHLWLPKAFALAQAYSPVQLRGLQARMQGGDICCESWEKHVTRSRNHWHECSIRQEAWWVKPMWACKGVGEDCGACQTRSLSKKWSHHQWQGSRSLSKKWSHHQWQGC